MRTGASCAIRQRNVILVPVCTRISLRKGDVFPLKNTPLRAGRGHGSAGGAKGVGGTFLRQKEQLRRDFPGAHGETGAGGSQWEGRKRLPSVLTPPLLPPAHSLAEVKELVSSLVEVCFCFCFFKLASGLGLCPDRRSRTVTLCGPKQRKTSENKYLGIF